MMKNKIAFDRFYEHLKKRTTTANKSIGEIRADSQMLGI